MRKHAEQVSYERSSQAQSLTIPPKLLTAAGSVGDSYPDKSYKDKPEGFDRDKHNQWGQRLAKEIKFYLPPDIKVRLLTINAEDEQKFRRNVNQEVID